VRYGIHATNGIQLTREFQALKLWLSLQVFGAAAFRAAIEHGFEMAEVARADSARARVGHRIAGADGDRLLPA
jgi:hypothetical protein